MRTAARILATRLWVWYAWHISGAVKVGDFIDRFDAYASPKSGYGLDPRLLRGWKRGKLYVSMTWVNRVEKEIPGTKWVHSIETLLTPRPLSAKAARGAVSQFFVTEPNDEKRWVMPYDGVSTSTKWDDSEALALRGDFAAFIAILALAREAFARTDYNRLCLHMTNLYTLLPSIVRLDWVRPDVDLLIQCIEGMMAENIYWLPAHVEIDWREFRNEVENPRRWACSPPWVVLKRGGGAENTPNRLLRRPVPLLEGVEPLADYVRPQELEVPEIKSPPRESFLDGWMNGGVSLRSKGNSP